MLLLRNCSQLPPVMEGLHEEGLLRVTARCGVLMNVDRVAWRLDSARLHYEKGRRTTELFPSQPLPRLSCSIRPANRTARHSWIKACIMRLVSRDLFWQTWLCRWLSSRRHRPGDATMAMCQPCAGCMCQGWHHRQANECPKNVPHASQERPSASHSLALFFPTLPQCTLSVLAASRPCSFSPDHWQKVELSTSFFRSST